MSEAEIVTINTEAPEEPGMDYNLLREEGLEHLQELAGKLWTDYNSHDPGVTMLEQLCYALTDLSYRTGYEMPDLLAVTEGDPYSCLYTPAEILTIKPVTVEDLRKVLVDIEGIQNAWIEPLDYPDDYFYHDSKQRLLTFDQLIDNPVKTKGFYRVLIQKDKEEPVADSVLQQQVEKCIQRNRKLGEDFREVLILDTQEVGLKATIEISAVEDADLLMAQIYRTTADYIAPYIHFYTLDEMLNKGKRIDEVMEGPVLQHGFIDTEEIKQLNKRTDLRISDIVHEVMKVEGVEVIRDVSLYSDGLDIDWVLNLDPRKAPEFDVKNTEIVLVKEDLEVAINEARVLQLFHDMKEDTQYPVLEENDRNYLLPGGDYRNIENYYPLQNYFPSTYGVGEAGLASDNPQRKGQAKQLKAYLLFFEQVLANYFAQIAHFKELMDFNNPDIKTYFAQTLSGLPGLEDLLIDPENYEQWLTSISEDEGSSTALDRKNRFLDHLLARFCEQFTDYSLIVYGSVEGEWYSPPEKQVYDKQTLLKEYPENSAERANGFDYTFPSMDTNNVPGIEKRLSNLLGIPHYQRRSLLGDFDNVANAIDQVYTGADDNTVESKNIYYLLDRGIYKKYYKYNSGTGKIEIHKKDTLLVATPLLSSAVQFSNPDVLAMTIERYTAEEYGAAVDGLIAQWQQWNSDLEGFYTTEHVLLCPQSAQQGGSFWEYASEITATERSKIGDGVRCTAPGHNLMHNEEIEIFDAVYYDEASSKDVTGPYNGTYRVYNVQKDHFEIEHFDIMGPSNQGKWVRTSMYKEPYSTQLSVILPDWPARFRNSAFREFIEQTIRRETPAHMQVYVHWFSRFDDVPDETWTTDDTKAYMDRLMIPYSTTDTQQDLLNKIPQQTAMEQWEGDYFQWLAKKAIESGQPDETWTQENVLEYMQYYGMEIPGNASLSELCNTTSAFIQCVQKWNLLYKKGTPDATWGEKDLRGFMDIFGIAYQTGDVQQTLLTAIHDFEQNFQKWDLLKNTAEISEAWTADELRQWMGFFQLPVLSTDNKTALVQKITLFQENARRWLDQETFPDNSWTDDQLKQLMDDFNIPYNSTQTRGDWQQAIVQYDQNCRRWVLWCVAQPGAGWTTDDLKQYMSGLGIQCPDTTTVEACLEQITWTEYGYQKWELLTGGTDTWVFPENTSKWTKEELSQFADEFNIGYNDSYTKTQLVTAIIQFEQQVAKWLDSSSNNLQYHAGKLLEYMRMGNTPAPYSLNEVGTIHFNASQRIDMDNFDLVDSGNREALGIAPVQTIEMWIKPDAIAAGNMQNLYSKNMEPVDKSAKPANEDIILNTSEDEDGKLQYNLTYNYNGGEIVFFENTPTGYWTHLAIVREETQVSFYINGKDTRKNLEITPRQFGELITFFMGGTNDQPYSGRMAELRIWEEAKDQQFIDNNKSAFLTGTEEGLTGYWKLDETLGNVALDSSPNANHGITAQYLSDPEIDAGLNVEPNPPTIAYKGIASVEVHDSQSDAGYQLRDDGDNSHWGVAKEGNEGTLSFEVNGLERTKTFNVLAVKTTNHQLDGLGQERVQLTQTATVEVNPKTDLLVTPLSMNIDHNGTATVQIMGIQKDVLYQLYHYDGGEIGDPTGDPEQGDEGGTITLTSGNLEEDTKLCIIATNIDS